jgi:hypothetical protein
MFHLRQMFCNIYLEQNRSVIREEYVNHPSTIFIHLSKRAYGISFLPVSVNASPSLTFEFFNKFFFMSHSTWTRLKGLLPKWLAPVCVHVSFLLVNGSVKTLPRQQITRKNIRMSGHVDSYTVCVISRESLRWVLRRTACYSSFSLSLVMISAILTRVSRRFLSSSG